MQALEHENFAILVKLKCKSLATSDFGPDRLSVLGSQ